jgi:hypothetical protein
MKIVINSCYGGFSISEECAKLARQLSGNPQWGGALLIGEKYNDGSTVSQFYGSIDDEYRTDPFLIQAIEQLGSEAASGSSANLTIENINSGDKYRICEYDGQEWIETKDSIDWKEAE